MIAALNFLSQIADAIFAAQMARTAQRITARQQVFCRHVG
jgi:hypothetical protein